MNTETRSLKSWRLRLGASEFKVMRLNESPSQEDMADTPERVADFLRKSLPGSLRYNPDTENFIAVLLNTRRRVIGFEIVSNGTLDTLLIHPREVFKPAIVLGAAAIVLAHNHPSGDPSPSESDIKVTRDLIRAGQLLKIEVLDHVILGSATPERTKDYASLRELGYFAI
jgi:DNA repair protein RadC